MVAAKKAGTLCLAFTTNGVPLTQRWVSERDELRVVRLFHQLGVRMMHLTYNRRNPLGDGAGEPNDGGLSDFGRQAIAEMNRLGVIVDVAHSGWRTSLEAAKASGRPMVASHTTCAGLYKHFRGKPDEAVRAICDTGGLIGICCIPRFLGGPGDITAFLDHIDYAVKRFGADHVAIGPDIAYTSRNDAAERAKVPRRKDGRSALALAGPRWEHLWPVDNYKETPRAIQSLAWTNWPLFTVGMVQRGHSDDDHPQDPRRERPPRLERQHAGEVLKETTQRPDPGGPPMHARAMVLLTLLSSAGSLVLTASFAGEPSSKSVPTYKVVAGWPEPSSPIKLGQVSAVATDASDRVFVFHRGEPPVVVFDRDGKYLRSWGEGLVKKAHGLRIDREQNVWTTDVGHHLVRKFDHEGTLLMTLGRKGVPGAGPDRFNQPTDVAVTPSGEFYVSDGYGNSRVVQFSKDGRYLKEWGTKGKGEGQFNLPHAIVLDPDGRIYVGDRENDRVQVFDPRGKFLAQWKEGGALTASSSPPTAASSWPTAAPAA